jgi:pimeloyl-ACP methyl ester carboxylesterase/tetratricopeptide (TPR) repeat protein
MILTFIVPGYEQALRSVSVSQPLPAGLAQGIVKHSVKVGTSRGVTSEVLINADPDKDIITLHIVDGPVLVLNPETARDLFLAQNGQSKRGEDGTSSESPNRVRVTPQLQWRGLEQREVETRGTKRGFLGDVFLALVQVITGVDKGQAVIGLANTLVEKIDNQVVPGVYALAADTLSRLKSAPRLTAMEPTLGGKPVLVLLHGTFSSTQGTFGKLWSEHPLKVDALFKHYENRVYGLEHPTLGVSPIANALALAQVLPVGARIHLLSHSRGGLVGEVLARVCGDPRLDINRMESIFQGNDYQTQRKELHALVEEQRKKNLQVERFVRVACPARGTLLASNRLDAFLSVFKWTLELAGVPVLPALVDFLAEVAQRRTKPQEIPGLAAQIPNSPLVRWLHDIEGPILGELRVVAGDLQGDSVGTWLKTLMADAYFWTDNDLVVQTSSMYGGAPRRRTSGFLLERGGEASHFNYFSSPRTTEAIVNGLIQDNPQGFRTIGPLSWQGESSSGDRGGSGNAPTSDKPAVFILPGILGSNLKVGERRIWIGPGLINGLRRLAYGMEQVEPDHPVGYVYNELMDFLSATHEVIEFAYDWRLPMETEAARLATAVEAAISARQRSGQPVRMLAHSMGGLLARTLQLEAPRTWDRMMANPKASLLMLGTPNGGSWAPMQVLSGDDTFGNGLTFAGAPLNPKEARDVMAGLPGFIQLQAGLLEPSLRLSSVDGWVALAEKDRAWLESLGWWHSLSKQLEFYQWGVPSRDVLERAVALRRRLDKQNLSAYQKQILLVVGRAEFTPDGFEIGERGVSFLDAKDGGDGRVTLKNALLPGVRTWVVDAEHGALPRERMAYSAYLSLLCTQRTSALKELGDGMSRGETMVSMGVSKHVRNRSLQARNMDPPETIGQLFETALDVAPMEANATRSPLAITVVNGNLKFIRQPLMIGHYSSSALEGAERVVDELVGGLLGDSLRLGLYPNQICSQQIFVNISVNSENPQQLPRPEATVVVGLGEEGKLNATDMVSTVRRAVIAWAQRLAEAQRGIPIQFDLASTLMGSGGTGITAGQVAGLIAQGVREANQRLKAMNWPTVGHLHLIELYLDRASDAWRALQVLAQSRPGEYNVSSIVETGIGWLRRPLEGGYRSASYDFISAITQYNEDGLPFIAYTLDTRRARSEVRAQAMQIALLQELVSTSSNTCAVMPPIGHTLFQLLVPVEMEPFLGGTTEMQIELDSSTASIPWELLDTRHGSSATDLPWSIRAKLLRKLRTSEFRSSVVDATQNSHVLVIGEPKIDDHLYPHLPGARAEAEAIKALFLELLGPERVKALISDEKNTGPEVDALTVTSALLERDWRIVHIAGHGEPPGLVNGHIGSNGTEKVGVSRGVVLSKGIFLGPTEIKSMRVVPELVFINCCYLAAADTNELLIPILKYDRARFAASVAEALIDIGVRCVVAAGWAVEDGPAERFATRFYESLLRGRRFLDAVALAREAAWLASRSTGGNTWAAYQCYGDPDWVLLRSDENAPETVWTATEVFEGVSSAPALTLALEALVDDSRYKKVDRKRVRQNLESLETRFAQQWSDLGEVAQAFGLAWAEIGDMDNAIHWYNRAIATNDGGASFKACEQLGNLRARRAWTSLAELEKALPPPDVRSKGEQLTFDEAVERARIEIKEALKQLTLLCSIQSTLERQSLCGSVSKRLALVEAVAGNGEAERKAINLMKTHYGKAEALAVQSNDPQWYYPALNRIAAELIVGSVANSPQLNKHLSVLRQTLERLVNEEPNFETVSSLIQTKLYQALANNRLEEELPCLEGELDDLHRRVPAVLKWGSVYDQTNFVLRRLELSTGAVEPAAQLLVRLKEWVGAES